MTSTNGNKALESWIDDFVASLCFFVPEGRSQNTSALSNCIQISSFVNARLELNPFTRVNLFQLNGGKVSSKSRVWNQAKKQKADKGGVRTPDHWKHQRSKVRASSAIHLLWLQCNQLSYLLVKCTRIIKIMALSHQIWNDRKLKTRSRQAINYQHPVFLREVKRNPICDGR